MSPVAPGMGTAVQGSLEQRTRGACKCVTDRQTDRARRKVPWDVRAASELSTMINEEGAAVIR